MPDSYNFRYQSQREAFYQDLLEQRREWGKYWEDNYSSDKAEELKSAMRITYDMDTSGDFSELNEDEQGKGNMRGFRTFRDLRILKQTLFDIRSSGYELTKRAGHYKTTARLVVFKRRGKRITGETVLWTAKITST